MKQQIKLFVYKRDKIANVTNINIWFRILKALYYRRSAIGENIVTRSTICLFAYFFVQLGCEHAQQNFLTLFALFLHQMLLYKYQTFIAMWTYFARTVYSFYMLFKGIRRAIAFITLWTLQTFISMHLRHVIFKLAFKCRSIIAFKACIFFIFLGLKMLLLKMWVSLNLSVEEFNARKELAANFNRQMIPTHVLGRCIFIHTIFIAVNTLNLLSHQVFVVDARIVFIQFCLREEISPAV